MQEDLPEIIKEVGFDFEWDEGRVWKLDVPISEMDIEQLEWHLDIPFLWKGRGVYNLKPREVIENPKDHPVEYERTMTANTTYPIDVMHNKGRWLILDGLHRLMKLHLRGDKKVRVRTIPREKIPDIRK